MSRRQKHADGSTAHEVDGPEFGVRIVRIAGQVDPGDCVVADLGGDGRAKTPEGVSNDEIFEAIFVLRVVDGWSYVVVRRV